MDNFVWMPENPRHEFYVFHHINDVTWDAWGELKGTKEAERLKRINRRYGI